MNKSPYTNAVLASLYIVAISFTMYYSQSFVPKEDNVFVPITMLSLLTFSASLMFYLLIWGPIRIYLDGRKEDAVNFFAKTLATFGLISLILISFVFLV